MQSAAMLYRSGGIPGLDDQRRFILFLIFALSLGLRSFSSVAAEMISPVPPEIINFVKAKEAQARSLADELKIDVSSDLWKFFETAKSGDVIGTVSAFERLKNRAGQYEGSRNDPTVTSPIFQTLLEAELAVECFGYIGEKYARMFGDSVVSTLPPNSIYFGGTDPGRGIITALSKSHQEGDPYFTLTQNALADANYLRYARAMYSEKQKLPTTNDFERAFDDYKADVQQRLDHDRRFPNEPRQMKPGEEVRSENGRLTASGQVSVMAINALIVKQIFDLNPDREFYIEESYPLDWMYPHLSPHGFIFKINREPIVEWSSELIARDRALWAEHQRGAIGDWLTPDTSVAEVCAWVDKTIVRKDLVGFKGDRVFVENPYVHKLYSKLRSATAGLYAWRSTQCTKQIQAIRSMSRFERQTKASEEKRLQQEQERMLAEAHFASKQAFAYCAYSPEALFRYANLLIELHSQQPKKGFLAEAILLAETALKLQPNDQYVSQLASSLKGTREGQAQVSANVAAGITKAEQAFEKNPKDLQSAIGLVSEYYKAGRTNDAFRVLDDITARPDVDYEALSVVAEAYRQLKNVPKLEGVLKRLTEILPQKPEAWYDLAAIQATLRKNGAALVSLSKAIQKSDIRIKGNPSERNLRTFLESDKRFDPLRTLPEFQKIVALPTE